MSLYGTNIKIDGRICGLIMRGGQNGYYIAIFEREFVSLDEIEGIDWSHPTIEGETVLPVGYGFEVVDIQYKMSTRSYQVVIRTAEQYLGDVTAYQAQVSELQDTVSQQTADIQAKDLEIQQKTETIETQTQQIQEKDLTIATQAEAITSKDATITSQSLELQEKAETIETQAQTISELEAEGSALELKNDLTDAYVRGVESNG